MEATILKRFGQTMDEKTFQDVNDFSCTAEKPFFVSVRMIEKMGGKKNNLKPMWDIQGGPLFTAGAATNNTAEGRRGPHHFWFSG